MCQAHRFLRGEYAVDSNDGYKFNLHMVADEYDDAKIESRHNLVQWCFPTDQPSAYNSDAPVLTPQDIQAIRSDPVAMKGFGRLFRLAKFESIAEPYI